MAKSKSKDEVVGVAGAGKGDDYAQAKKDTGVGHEESQEAGDGKKWQYADASLDTSDDAAADPDEVPHRPGTPSALIHDVLKDRRGGK